MKLEKAKQVYDPIVKAQRGRYFGDLKNPVSRPFVGAHGKVYRTVFVRNPLNGDDIDRVLISEEDVPKLDQLLEIAITSKGDVIGRKKRDKNSTHQVSLEFLIYGEFPRNIVHINQNMLDFRRTNICKIKPLEKGKFTIEDISQTEGYWNTSFEGSTRALISLCIRDNPNQRWDELVKTVSDLKNCPVKETEQHLREFQERQMLGYHEGSDWKEWVGK